MITDFKILSEKYLAGTISEKEFENLDLLLEKQPELKNLLSDLLLQDIQIEEALKIKNHLKKRVTKLPPKKQFPLIQILVVATFLISCIGLFYIFENGGVHDNREHYLNESFQDLKFLKNWKSESKNNGEVKLISMKNEAKVILSSQGESGYIAIETPPINPNKKDLFFAFSSAPPIFRGTVEYGYHLYVNDELYVTSSFILKQIKKSEFEATELRLYQTNKKENFRKTKILRSCPSLETTINLTAGSPIEIPNKNKKPHHILSDSISNFGINKFHIKLFSRVNSKTGFINLPLNYAYTARSEEEINKLISK